MAKITRQTQQIFGVNSGFQQITQFGSTAAGNTVYTTNIATIQALSNYLVGWFNAVENGSYPAIQDMNALHFLYAYQLAYIMQAGVSEYDAATPYYTGSIANDGFGSLYRSITDNNTGNALSDTTNWLPPGASLNTARATDLTIPTGYNYNSSFTTIGVGVTYTINGTAVFSALTAINGTLAVGTSATIHFN